MHKNRLFSEYAIFSDTAANKHMCPKDFTGGCIINTILEPAPSLSAKWRFVGLKHCPAEAGQFRPVITGFRPSRQWRISLRALPAISLQGILPCNVSCLEIVRAYGPQELIFTCIAALDELHRNLPLADEIASYEASKST
ncbi:MAG: hypothetical protein IKW48_10545 [Akkermansia sp.]|nr:hypothetical protein [Akkermansia sp.]